ncbi:MAG: DUF1566 domain-containing protein, partial [Candidatus Electrothrix sp. MAN1_4]|nr:DUF1566 domain-containing protein [Candidatus Electrothrix sp. MAN1_4]
SGTGGTAQNYGSLAPLRSLKILDISRNRIKNEIAVLELNKLSGLEELNLSHNDISLFPGAELPVQSLQLLDLSHNDLTEIPYVQMDALKIWDLQGNGAVRLADDYGDMFSLKSIKKLQYDSGSDYDNLSELPKGLQKKLAHLAKKEKERLRKQRELDCSTGGVKIGQYIDHCDGTITDTKTGLMWKRCSEGSSGINCEKGKKETYKWRNTLPQIFQDTKYAEYFDWRLPTADELKTLVYCSNGTPSSVAWDKGCDKDDTFADEFNKPAINQQAFPNTSSYSYWSFSPDIGRRKYVTFGNGKLGDSGAPQVCSVRLVRGGQ